MYKIPESIKVDENLTTNVLIIYIYIFIFLYLPVFCLTLCFRFRGGHKPKKHKVRQLGVVAARLDTFGTRYSFLPFYYILYLFFFWSPRNVFSYFCCFVWIEQNNKSKKKRGSGSHARLDTFGVMFPFLFTHAIYFSLRCHSFFIDRSGGVMQDST